MSRVANLIKYLIVLAALLSAPPALAGDTPPKPLNIEKLLQDIRDLDTSTETEGDHVVGETLC